MQALDGEVPLGQQRVDRPGIQTRRRLEAERNAAALGAALGLADAAAGDRMGAQELGGLQLADGRAQGAVHAREEVGHRHRLVAGAGERQDADAVGFVLVAAGVVDLALLHQRHAADDGRLGGIAAAVAACALRHRDRAERGQQDRDGILLLALDRAHDVALGHVGDFVRHHRRHFVLAGRRQHQAGVHADVAAEGGEGVDVARAHPEKGEVQLRALADAGEALAQRRQILVEQRVFQQHAVGTQFAPRVFAIHGLFGGRDQGAGRGTHVRQRQRITRLRGGAGGQGQCRWQQQHAKATREGGGQGHGPDSWGAAKGHLGRRRARRG
jgi:hypothetical protein